MTFTPDLRAPFPYFGGKSKIAPQVWERLGNTPNYVEPFFGSGAMLLARPGQDWGIETVNDASGFVANFWRALQHDPESVAMYADNPVNENDLHARHAWLVARKESLASRLEGNPDWYDTKIAGWWVWGMSCWIGSGFCSGDGPWHVVDGELVNTKADGNGVKRKLVHLGDAGRGVNRQQLALLDYMQGLAERMADVRVCCGDWARICGDTPTIKNGLTAVFLDPPYSAEAGRNNNLYEKEDLSVAHDVRAWCIERGDNPLFRIALCGYDGEGHEELESHGWTALNWKTSGGYGSQGSQGSLNATREVVWFSPHCIRPQRQATLFAYPLQEATP